MCDYLCLEKRCHGVFVNVCRCVLTWWLYVSSNVLLSAPSGVLSHGRYVFLVMFNPIVVVFLLICVVSA